LAALANQADRSYGVVINPDKAAAVSLGAGISCVVAER
jgi:hypothetical protein